MDCNKLNSIIASYKRKSASNPYLGELSILKERFLKDDRFLGDLYSWKIISDYLTSISYGWTSKKQEAKVRELLIKYGLDSGFWEIVESSRKERTLYLKRLAYLVVTIRDFIDKKEGAINTRKILGRFLSSAHQFHKRLHLVPLTEKQKMYMYKIERIVGIYYNDLSPKENGESWEEV